MNYFHKNLKFLLREKNLSKSQLSKELNITRQAINDWTNNNIYPTYDNLVKLSIILNVSIDDMLKKGLENERDRN